MNSSIQLDSLTVPLTGINLVEAAAGTGKTHNIQNLVARMILERALNIDEIIVLSFTNEAAAELSKRIRKILDDILALLEKIPVDNPQQAQAVIDHDRSIHPDTPDSDRIRLIRNALRDFDLAHISTINGFCQKLLTRFAFESNLTFDSKLETDTQVMVVELLEDWMRNKFYGDGRSNELISALISQHDIADLKRHVLDFNLTIPEYPEIDLAAQLDLLLEFHEKSDDLSALDESMFNKRSRFVRDREKLETALKNHDGVTILNLAGGFSPETLVNDALKAHKAEVDSLVSNSIFFKHISYICGIYETACAAYKADAIRYARERFEALERQGNFMTFADQIKLVDEALQKSSGLKEKLQEKFKAGIIDEFQDTDAMQYRIFKSMFDRPECCVFLVGDPRQAIYRFRGGDINAYLRAKKEISVSGNIYHLSTNFRSSVNMVSAVNDIFANRYKPFGDIDIDFPELASRPAESAPELICDGKSAVHAMIRHVSPRGNHPLLQFACAQRIGDLISEDSPEKLPDNSPIRPGDIAILLRSNSECVQMQTILEFYNIPAVCLKNGNIFNDVESSALYQVLCGALNPGDHRKVSTALAGFLCNIPLAELDVSVAANGDKFAAYLEKFQRMNQLWYQQGFAVMFEYFLNAFNVRENLAARPDGERRLTNLYQLGELLHAKAESLRMPPLVLTGKFGDMIAQSEDSLYHTEEHEELMSSGDSAVRIMTIHASKGLQFPVVMLPGLQRLSSSGGKELDGVFYNGSSRELNLNGNLQHREIELREIQEEKRRLIYVALTRSEYRCEIFESEELPESVWNDLIRPVQERIFSVPLVFHQEYPRFRNRILPLADSIPEIADIHPKWQLTSYSALTRNISGKNRITGDNSPVDHDEFTAGSKETTDLSTTNGSGFSPFALPGGAGFGNTLHEIFERIDFAGDRMLFEKAAVTLLKRSGNQELCQLPGYPGAVGNWLHDIFHSPLTDFDGESFTLAEISGTDRITEMEFYCDMQDFDLKEMKQLLDEYLVQEFGTAGWPEDCEENFNGGILNGFIDLIFRRGGRYYIVDWKSNILGGNPENFRPEKLSSAMIHSFYFLQYMFYLVALIRYLRHFNNGIFGEKEYESMIGGIYYLFVRGITPKHPQHGVFQARPPWQVIQQLEALICSKMK